MLKKLFPLFVSEFASKTIFYLAEGHLKSPPLKLSATIVFFFLALTSSAQQSEAEIQKELAQLHRQTKETRNSVSALLKSSYEAFQATSDLVVREQLRLHSDSLYNISDRNDIAELRINLEYAKKHPSSAYCFELVRGQIARQPGKDFYDDFEYIWNHAPKAIQESESGKIMAEQLIDFKQSKVGSRAPAFAGTDIANTEIALNDFIGKKYVLIDFWASWCAPCCEELPDLKELYRKYQDLDFEIISVSIDEDLAKWKNAVSKHGIGNWKHFSAAQNNSTMKKDYFVSGIPHKVLIDKNGVIIGKWKASGELNKRSLESQLRTLFGY
jgi:peroxiredoxin